MATSTETLIDFSSHVTERTRDFTGRGWVFQAIDGWLADARHPRFFLLTGNPGSGKTAIAGRLHQVAQGQVFPPPGLAHLTPGFLSAVHFCSARDGRWIDPRTFSQSIALQLSKIPEYAQALKDVGDKTITIGVQQTVGTAHEGAVVAAVVINHLVLSGLNSQEAFNRTVLDPLHSIYRKGFTKAITLLVDALDESLSYEGDVTILELLSRLEDLPAQVRIILTSRRDARVENEFLEAPGLFLSAPEYEGSNQEDINGYVDWRLRHGEGLVEPVAHLSPEQQVNVTNTIVRKAEGNFLYVRFLLDALAKGQQTLDNLEELPAGLDGLYYRSLERVIGLGNKNWSRDYAPLVGVLSVAQESLTQAQLQAFTGQSEGTVWECLGDLQQFVQEVQPKDAHGTGQEQYRLYHQSVIDFFHRRQLSAEMKILRNRYYLPAAEWHRRMTDAYRLKPGGDWDQCDHYGLRYLPVHLAGSGQLHELRALLFDFRWLQAKLNSTDIVALIADYALLSGDAALLTVCDALLLSAHVLAQDKAQLPSQMLGRLLVSQEPEILRLLEQATAHAAAPWLCPLTASLQAPGGPLKRTLVGHRGIGHGATVNGIALLPDGTRVISAASDKTLKVWNLQSGAVERTLTGHEGWVSAVAVTPDGRRAISASWDKTLRVWNLETGDVERTLAGHDSAVLAVALINGHLAISASADKTLKVWNLATGMVKHTLIGHDDAVSAVALVPGGSQAMSASKDRTLRVWNLTTGNLEATLRGHSRGIEAVAVTPDGKRAISASEDASLKVWNLRTGTAELTWQGHTDSVRAIAVMPDGVRAISGSSDRTLKVWNINTGILARTLAALEPVKAVALASEGAWAISASSTGTLRVWDLAAASNERGPADHAGVVVGIAITADGMRAVSASADKTLKVWNLAYYTEERTLTGHSETVRAVVTLPDGRHAVSASWDNTLRLWNMQTGTVERTLTSGAYTINALAALPPDGRRIISASEARVLQVWNLDTGAVERELRTAHTSGIMALAITPDGARAVTGSTDTTLRVYDLLTGTEQCILSGHDNTVVSVIVTHDGRRAISSSRDLTVRVWDLQSGAEKGTLIGHTNRVHGLAVTRDDLRAASASEDNTVRVWDLRDGRVVAAFTGDSQMTTCAIAPDGITVIAGDGVGKVHFLRLTCASE